MRIAVAATLLVACSLSAAPPSRAAESYDNCAGVITSLPATINTQGTWCLKADLATAMNNGTAISVAAHNVTIDCNGFKIGGLAAGLLTGTNGIVATDRSNLVVRHCNIRGFYVGIFTSGGGGHVVEDNRFDGNNAIGVLLNSPGSTIRRNQVMDTGGRPNSGVGGTGLYAQSGVDVLDNTVSGLLPGGFGGQVFGIYSNSNVGATISGNRVNGLMPGASSPAWGIYDESGGVLIDGNFLNAADVALSTGVRCGGLSAVASRNAITGFTEGVVDCYSSDNIVNPN